MLEDLHWADLATMEVIAFLARSLGTERVMVVVTVRDGELRPEQRETRLLAELQRGPLVDRLVVSGLDRAGTAELAERLTSRRPTREQVDVLARRTGGNPFFIGELARADSLHAPGLPASLRELLSVPLTGLDPTALDALRAVAVIDGEVPFDLLCDVLEPSATEVERILGELQRQGQLEPGSEVGSVRFRHALLQETVLADVGPLERRSLHGSVADLLAADGRPAAVLAGHQERAGRIGDAFASAVIAAREAAGSFGSLGALPHYERALRLWPTEGGDAAAGTDRAGLLMEASACALASGETERGAAWAAEALGDLVDEARHEERAATALQLSELRWEQGDAVEADRLLAEARSLIDPVTRPDLQSRLLERRAFLAITSGDLTEAVSVARAAVETARGVPDPILEVDALNRLAIALAATGGFTEGLGLLEDARRLSRTHRNGRGITRTAINHVALLDSACRLDAARAVGDVGLAESEELGCPRPYRAALYALQAGVLFQRGEWEEAQAVLDEAPADPGRQYRWFLETVQARLHVGRGDIGRARSVLDGVTADASAHLAWTVQTAVAEAELALARSAHQDAVRAIAPVLELAELYPDASFLHLVALVLIARAGGATPMLGLEDDDDALLRRAERKAEALDRDLEEAPDDTTPMLEAVRALHAQVAGLDPHDHWDRARRGLADARCETLAAWADVRHSRACGLDAGRRRGLEDRLEWAKRNGARPLRRAIEQLLRAGAVDPPQEAGASPDADPRAVGRSVVEFGDVELDLDLFELRRDGSAVAVEPQVFDVLAYLVEHRDRVVTKEELLDEVWGDRFVSESALTTRIKKARQVLGDDGRTQSMIRTAHGRGYRFVAPVTGD
ncbi:MAG: winged helix-turn-helix domain-containing protein [Actinomycetota bacterium]